MNTIELIKQPVVKEMEEFKQLFDSSLCAENELLNHALTQIKSRRGKMMRPILVMLMAKLHGSINSSTQHAALSLELLHTASLVHDDVVDESDERRGQKSMKAIYNNKVAVLVGDYLLASSLKHAAYTSIIELVELVSKLGQQLSEGEIIQLSNTDNKDFSEDVYFEVIRKKTAALFAVSAEAGAVSVSASEEDIQKAGQFGELIGIAFQIKDDIFDYFDNQNIGKPTGNDMREGKLTLPALYMLNKLNDEALNAIALKIRASEATDDEISFFVNRVKEEGGIEHAEAVMYAYRDKALTLLPSSMDASLRDALVAYIDYVIERKK